MSIYDLPDLNGFQLLRAIRVTAPTLPFVLAAVDGTESHASNAMMKGVSRYAAHDEEPETTVKHLEETIERMRSWRKEESGHSYHHLIETAPVPINLFDETGESIWCNHAVLDLLELKSRNELIGQSIFQYIHPDDHELAATELKTVIEEKRSCGPTQMKLRTATGETRHVFVSTAIGNFLGEDIGQAIVVDVTDLREARNELQTEREIIETAVNSFDDLFYILDGDGELQRWNEAAESITGYSVESIPSMRVEEFFATEDKTAIVESIRRIRETGSDTVEARVETADGRRIPYEFRGSLLESGIDDDGVRIVGIGRNISDREERKRQLLVLERWLRHNIRNELNIIQGYATRIREEDEADPRALAAVIEKAASSLLKQADNQRRVVDLVANPSDPERQHLHALIHAVLADQRRGFPDAELELHGATQVEVDAIPELRYAFRELIENAVIHNDSETPVVEIEIEDGETDGIVRIKDNGPGIPAIEQLESRIDQEITQLSHGSGLGLYFAHWAVQNSHGTLNISANTPRGSVVTISLPKTHPE